MCARHTFTYEQDVVVAKAHWTFATETSDLVDAHSVCADAWYFPTLVDIWEDETETILLEVKKVFVFLL